MRKAEPECARRESKLSGHRHSKERISIEQGISIFAFAYVCRLVIVGENVMIHDRLGSRVVF